MKKLLILTLCLLSPLTFAQNSGFYVGASIGQSDADIGGRINDEIGILPPFINFISDYKDTTQKFELGYNINDYFSIGGSLDQLGSISIDINDGSNQVGIRAETDGYTLGGRAKLPLTSSFNIFADLGVLFWDSELSTYDLVGGAFDKYSFSGDDPYYGVGAGFSFQQLDFTASYTMYKQDDLDINILAVGIRFNF